nr:MAG TPA: hypothetical protein [Caudoviricetes sp.]
MTQKPTPAEGVAARAAEAQVQDRQLAVLAAAASCVFASIKPHKRERSVIK